MFEKLSPHPNPLPNGEGIVETKTCKFCNISFVITDKDLEFYEKVSPIFDGKKYLIPSPTLCPDCRQQRRLSFRNERKLYKRKCDFSGKDIVSIYSPDKKYKVYDNAIWGSYKWNPLDYGKEFDFNKGFFEQFGNLFENVPKMPLINNYIDDLNSLFSNYAGNNKNCYLIFNADFNEDCLYMSSGFNNKNCVDCFNNHNSENCYECVDITNCHSSIYSNNLFNCSFCSFCKKCVGCKNCFGCVGLENNEFCFLNEKYTKSEYYKKVEEIKFGKLDFLKFYNNLVIKKPYKYIYGLNFENSFGNYLYNTKNVNNSYEIYNTEECKYCLGIHEAKTCYDITYFGINSLERSYECHAIGVNSNNIFFSSNIVNSNYNIYYSYFLYNNCQNCFGCVGLKNKSYCILNKQYSKEEYEKLVPRIIEKMQETGEWGEFFPSSLSPFGYNETVANEYFPLENPVFPQSQPFYHKGTLPPREKGVEQELISSFPIKGGGLRGSFNWSFYESPFPKVEKIITVEMYSNTSLLEDISKIPDDILNWAIECEKTGKPFRIIKQELEFYRKHNLPIPKIHPDQRHLDRMALRNPRKLFDRKCDKCGKNIKTTYSPDRKEIIYCESCYEKEIY